MTKDTIQAEKGCAEMRDFCMDVSYRSSDKSQKFVVIAHFLTWRIIRTWKAVDVHPHAFQVLMMHLIGICAISTWAWVLAIIS